MVEVLKINNPSLRVTCNTCDCELAYRKIEILRIDGTDYGGGPDGCEYILCPNCNSRVILRAW